LRFAVAYIMAGGFIIQIGSAVFPTSDLPNWSLRLLPNRAGQSRIYLT
jgi:Na+/H+ antiporter NhaD/arsenite permease-like protein